MRTPSLLFVGALVACGQTQAPQRATTPPAQGPASAPAEAPAAPPEPPPTLRLPADLARPLSYALDLTVVPSQDTFTGTADIEIDLLKPSDVIWLNGRGLTVAKAALDGAPVTVAAANDHVLGIHLPAQHAPGKVALHLEYSGKIDPTDDAGVFSEQLDGVRYAFTQFEWFYARRAFPCFDEPGWKTPYQLTLHVKHGHLAVSNTPIVSETDEPGGMKAVKFARTRPLPSYLVAWAVGPFDVVDAGKTKGGVPVRVIVPRGAAGQASYVAQAEPEILDRLAAYFDIPYAYPKLDVVAIPSFFGAMENAGMITYGFTTILARKSDETTQFKRAASAIIAHETAHQWFGDLVTTAWWNDIWLNEAFAEWMTYRVLDEMHPDWKEWEHMFAERAGALHSDSLASARQIRQPIQSADDISNAFDDITYGKGAAVIRMFELWIGPETFRKGVHAYLSKHADGTATAADFLAAQSAASGKDVATPLSTFLDQPGVPLIDVKLACAKTPTVTLAVSRFVPAGSPGDKKGSWQIPVCLRWGPAAGDRTCTLVTHATRDLALPLKTCPDFLTANAGGAGYYLTLYEGGLLARLLGRDWKKLSHPEQAALVYELGVEISGNRVGAADVLAGIPRMARASDLRMLREVARIVSALGNSPMISDAARPAYRRFVDKVFGAKARALGWSAKKGENDETKLTRPDLVSAVAGLGDDRRLVAGAKKVAKAWLADHTAVSADLAGPALRVASLHGDQAWYDAVHAALRAAKDPKDRQLLGGALVAFADPAIEKQALALCLSNEIPAREAVRFLMFGMRDYRTRATIYDFVDAHFDEVRKLLPGPFGQYIMYVGAGVCDAAGKARYQKSYGPRSKSIVGAPHIFQQVGEIIDVCIATRAEQAPRIASFLRRY